MPLTATEREALLERQYRTTSAFTEDVVVLEEPPAPTTPWTPVDVSPCGGARNFANAARKLGYEAEIHRAVGPWLYADGGWDGNRESVRVIVSKDGAWVAACWWTKVEGRDDWSVHRGMAAGLIGPLSAKQLKQRLTNPQEDPRV